MKYVSLKFYVITSVLGVTKPNLAPPFLLNYFKSPLIWPKYAKKILGQAPAAPAHPFLLILNPPMSYA